MLDSASKKKGSKDAKDSSPGMESPKAKAATQPEKQ
jgi:hypothetical protein